MSEERRDETRRRSPASSKVNLPASTRSRDRSSRRTLEWLAVLNDSGEDTLSLGLASHDTPIDFSDGRPTLHLPAATTAKSSAEQCSRDKNPGAVGRCGRCVCVSRHKRVLCTKLKEGTQVAIDSVCVSQLQRWRVTFCAARNSDVPQARALVNSVHSDVAPNLVRTLKSL